MKATDPHPSCSCDRPARPQPPRHPSGPFLLHRILGTGKTHRRCQCYPLSVDSFPCQGTPPYTLINATTCGELTWQELPWHEKGAVLLQVSIPLALQLRDSQGCIFSVSSSIEDQVCLHCFCPEAECWRGQIHLQAAVRLCGCPQFCQERPWEARLEVILEGFLLTACPVSGPGKPPCPPPRPLYPESPFDPWQNR